MTGVERSLPRLRVLSYVITHCHHHACPDPACYHVGMAPRRMRIAALVVGGLILAGGAFVAHRALWLPSPASWPERTFTPEAWTAAAPEQRHAFWRELERRSALPGRSLAEVVALLGPPDFQCDQYVDWIVKHRDPRELSWDAIYVLRLHLDATDRVTRAGIVAD